MSTAALRSWTTFFDSDIKGHFEVRDGIFCALSDEQLEACRASMVDVASASSSSQGFGPSFPYPQAPVPYGYHQPLDALGMQAGVPYGFPGSFPPTFTTFPPNMGAGLPAPFAPNFQRPSSVQVSEMSDEKPHIHSFMKHNRPLFDALQAAYPTKAITLLSEPQLKTLLNKYAKEHDTSPPPPRATRSKTAGDSAELGKKGGKRRAPEASDEDEAPTTSSSSSSSSSSSPSSSPTAVRQRSAEKTSKVAVEKPKKRKKGKKTAELTDNEDR